MLSEEALILVAVVGACALLVLGVLELVWPTRPRHPRRSRAESAPARPAVAAAPPRPAQSILPRRLIDSPASRPAGGFVFPPPADYVPPPLPREEIRPIRPAEPASSVRPIGIVRPAAPEEEHAATPPPIEDVAPEALEPAERSSVEESPGTACIPPPAEIEPQPLEPYVAPVETEPVAFEPAPHPVEPEPASPGAIEPERPLFEPEPSPIEPATAAYDAEPPVFDVGPPAFDAEPPAFDAEPPAFDAEPSPQLEREPMVQASSAAAEPVPEPVEPERPAIDATPPVEPLSPPITRERRLIAEPAPEAVEPEWPAIDAATPLVEPPSPPTPERTPIAQLAEPLEPVAPPPEQGQPPMPPEPPAPPRRRRSKISPHARPHRVLRPAPHGPSPERASSHLTPPPAAESAAKPALSSERPPGGVDGKLTRDSPLVERCFALYQEQRFDEVLTAGEQALAATRCDDPTAGPSRDTAALWSVVGLAKQALGDDDGAHAALASSIDAAFETERPTYRRHLTTHALEAAQARLARAGSHDPGDRISVIRGAIAWTERGLAVVPWDPALIDTRDAAHEALWQAYEHAATALLQRQEFPGARQLLREALDDPKLPAARAAAFRGLLSGTFGGEIGQLTAQAILTMQDGRESEALGVLQRAEELLGTIAPDALPPTRRDEVDQRLWWAYAELGSRRLDAGDYEEALDPLLHALRFSSIGPERQAETRAAVVRALEGIAAVRALSIRRLAEAGSRDEAIVAAGTLQEIVKRGLEVGISEEELVAAFARVRRLCEELGMDARA